MTLLGRVRKHTDADLGAQADLRLRLSVGVLRSGAVSTGVSAGLAYRF